MSYGRTAPEGIPQDIWDRAIAEWLADDSTVDSARIVRIAKRLLKGSGGAKIIRARVRQRREALDIVGLSADHPTHHVILLQPVERKRMMCSSTDQNAALARAHWSRKVPTARPIVLRRTPMPRKGSWINDFSGETNPERSGPGATTSLAPPGSSGSSRVDKVGLADTLDTKARCLASRCKGHLPHPTSY